MQSVKRYTPRRVKSLWPKLILCLRRLRWWRSHLATVTLGEIVGPQAPHLALDPILDDVCMPPYVGSSFDDFGSLMRIVHWLQPQTVLELGTAYGNTVANICRQVPETQIYTVNAPAEKQTGALTTYSLTNEEIGRVYRAYGYDSRVTQILENTLNLDLAGIFAQAVIDLVIIDACHDTEYVMQDFEKTAPLVREGGIVLLHDTHPSMRGHYYGSYRACMLLRKQGYDIRHLAGTSWGIWINGWDEQLVRKLQYGEAGA